MAVSPAVFGFFSPILREIMEEAETLNPMATEYEKVMIDSVVPAMEMAFEPSLLTKNRLAHTNNDSITSSSTIGTASNTMARLMLPVVNRFSFPEIASFNRSKTYALYVNAAFIFCLYNFIITQTISVMQQAPAA